MDSPFLFGMLHILISCSHMAALRLERVWMCARAEDRQNLANGIVLAGAGQLSPFAMRLAVQ